MNTVDEIEQAIQALTPQQLQEFSAWFERKITQSIDARIPSDLAKGRLDSAISRALEDNEDGRIRAL